MVLVAFIAINGNVSAATTLYVDDDYDSLTPGWGTTHFDKIQDAIDAASSGDTIMVAAGTYAEYLHITTDDLTIEGAGIDKSVIDLNGLTPYWHYSGSGSFASRAGVLITGYGSPDQIIEDVTFRGFTVKNAGLNPPTTATGTHTAVASSTTTLTDSTKSWATDALVGQWIHNYGDKDPADWNPARSYGLITGNDATTVTVASLSKGKENDWDTGDPYLITPYEEFHNTIWIHHPNYDGLRGIAIGNGKDVLIQNCKVTRCGVGGISSGYARLVSTHKYSEGITVDNCIVTDHLTSGISIGQHVGALTVTNNIVERNKRPDYVDASRENAGRGIEVSGTKYYGKASGLIANNKVNDNGFEGIILAKYIDGVTVENNKVTKHNLDQDGAGIFLYGDKSNPANCKNNIIRDNKVEKNIRGIVGYYASYSTIEGNKIKTDSGAFPEGQGAIKIDGSNNMLVKDNDISCDGTGITVQNTWNDVESYDNTFTGNTIKKAKFAGIYIRAGAHDNEFTYNTIKETKILTRGTETQADGVFINDDAGTGNVFHYNTIEKNKGDSMESQITATIDAEFNYWGDKDPSDDVVGNVDYDPWLGKKVGGKHQEYHTATDIQYTIDETSAGDTVKVHAGTYNVATQITIDKALKLKGEDAATTIINGPGSSVNIPCEGLIAVDGVSGDVTIEKFTLQNAPERAFTWSTSLLVVKNLPANAKVTIKDNILVGRNNNNAFDTGIWIGEGSSTSQVTIKDNDLSRMFTGILLERMLGPSNVEKNDIHHLVAGVWGPFTSAPQGLRYLTYLGDVNTEQLAKKNTFRNYAGYCICVQGGHAWIGDGKFTDMKIKDNTLNAIGSGPEDAHVGIVLLNDYATSYSASGVHNAEITGNTITTGGTGSKGIVIDGHNTGIEIHKNTITALETGILVQATVGTPGITVNKNNIYGNTNYGLNNLASSTVDAENNWWGHKSGPGGIGPGSGDAVSAYVDYDPWLKKKAK